MCNVHTDSQAAIAAANTCTFPTQRLFNNNSWRRVRSCSLFKSSSEDSDCNVEKRAPDKEPAVYVAESAISSGSAGSSSDGAEKTAAITAGLALIFVAAASTVLQAGKNRPQVQTLEYSGPSLS